MKNIILPALALVVLLPTQPILADQAHARAGGMAGQEGQVILFQDGGACFGLTPQHLMAAGFGRPATLIRHERVTMDGFATPVLDLGHDLALVAVGGAIARDCGPPLEDWGDPRGRIQAAGGQVVMRHVTAAGTTRFQPVHVHAVTQSHIHFEEAGEGAAAWTVAPGHSGSALMLGDEVVGVVLEQGSADELPRALLWSFAIHIADWRLRHAAPQDGHEAAPDPAPADGVLVERTSTRALSPEHGAERLVAPIEDGGFWQAEAAAWPVDIVLSLPAIQGVTEIILHPAPEEVQGHPRRIELFTTRSGEGEQRWRSIGGHTLSPGAGPRRIALGGGQRMRRLRLQIHDTWSAGDAIALGRIELRTAE